MSEAQTVLLRPNQIQEYEATEKALRENLDNRDIQDKAAVRGQLRRLQHNLEKQRPIPPVGEAKDKLAKETNELLDKILVGMPSQAEMRRCPPGAIDKHRMWEKRNKDNIRRWKNNRLRLFAGTDNVDIANLEMYRPTKNSLNMENSYISGQDYNLPDVVGHCSPYTDEEIKLIKQRAPDAVWSKLPVLTSEQRALVRQIYVETWEEPSGPPEDVTFQEVTEDEEGENIPLAAQVTDRFDADPERDDGLDVESDLWGSSNSVESTPAPPARGRSKTRRR